MPLAYISLVLSTRRGKNEIKRRNISRMTKKKTKRN